MELRSPAEGLEIQNAAMDLLLTRVSALTGRGAASLSSFGGEGQGEEAVVLNHRVKYLEAASSWSVTASCGIEKKDEPPLYEPRNRLEKAASSPQPSPPKEERESRPPVACVRQLRLGWQS